jgi:NACHT domain
MSAELEIVKTVITPFAPTIIDLFVKPKLLKLAKFFKKNQVNALISVEAKFTEYLTRSYEKYSFIPILIFQNQQKKLADIYVPLTVRKERDAQAEAFLIDDYPHEFLPKYKKVLIRDTAGMGKSTLMKKLFLACLEQQKGIPVFIELRKLKGADSIPAFIHRELNPINEEFDAEFVLNLIKEGNFIFFLDGYDEISQSEREKVTQNLQDFISKTGDNLFIMTSRPETSLSSFPDFMEFDIQPLKLEEAFNLLRKYDRQSNLSAEIISKLEGEMLRSVKDFLTNPLLVSLLYKSYDYKRTIPLKKHNFYRQVYDSLFDWHDSTKESWTREKFSGLDSDSFHAVLRALGIITIKHGIEYDKDEILAFIKQAKKHCSVIEFKENKFLEDLRQTVPLFSQEGNFFRWSHKSLQDYFAAQFIWLDTGEKKPEVLRKIARSFDNEKYENVLDLYYEIDYKAFRQIILYDYLSEFITYFDAHITIQSEEDLSKEIIENTKLLTFDSVYVIPKMSELPDFSKTTDILETISNYFSSKYHIKIEEKFRVTYLKGFIQYVNYNYLLTNLLKTKSEHIFLENSKLPVIFEIPKDIIYIGNNLIINNQTWQPESNNFAAIIDFLLSHSDKLMLDIKACCKLKIEIEREIEKEKINDLFADL